MALSQRSASAERIARTLADLGGSTAIRPDDILVAIQFRSLDGK